MWMLVWETHTEAWGGNGHRAKQGVSKNWTAQPLGVLKPETCWRHCADPELALQIASYVPFSSPGAVWGWPTGVCNGETFHFGASQKPLLTTENFRSFHSLCVCLPASVDLFLTICFHLEEWKLFLYRNVNCLSVQASCGTPLTKGPSILFDFFKKDSTRRNGRSVFNLILKFRNCSDSCCIFKILKPRLISVLSTCMRWPTLFHYEIAPSVFHLMEISFPPSWRPFWPSVPQPPPSRHPPTHACTHQILHYCTYSAFSGSSNF